MLFLCPNDIFFSKMKNSSLNARRERQRQREARFFYSYFYLGHKVFPQFMLHFKSLLVFLQWNPHEMRGKSM